MTAEYSPRLVLRDWYFSKPLEAERCPTGLNLVKLRKCVFVTQLEHVRGEEEDNINRVPIIKEPANKVLETAPNTLQKTLVLKKEVEFNRVNAQFLAKQHEFKERMEAVEQKRAEYIKRQEEYKKTALKFDQFLKENDAKRRRAIEKYQNEVKQNKIRQKEINELIQQLEELKLRQKKLHKMVANYKIYEDYLTKVVARVPENYLDSGADTLLKAVMGKHEALSSMNKTLLSYLVSLSEDYEKTQHKLEDMHRKHDTTKLMLTSELSQLQMEYDKLQETNKQLELKVSFLKSHFLHQSEELSSMFLSISNLAEQCHMPHYGPLQSLTLLPKLDMIKEFILKKMNMGHLHLQTVKTQLPVSGDQSQSKKTKTKKEKLKNKAAAGGSIGTVQNQQK